MINDNHVIKFLLSLIKAEKTALWSASKLFYTQINYEIDLGIYPGLSNVLLRKDTWFCCEMVIGMFLLSIVRFSPYFFPEKAIFLFVF